jgi:hypothetical protein
MHRGAESELALTWLTLAVPLRVEMGLLEHERQNLKQETMALNGNAWFAQKKQISRVLRILRHLERGQNFHVGGCIMPDEHLLVRCSFRPFISEMRKEWTGTGKQDRKVKT